MRERFLYACLFGPLILALNCCGDELCSYYWGHLGLTKQCRDSYCCGTRTYGYCCQSCELRYPPVNNCNTSPTDNMSTLSVMQITWLVVGFILLIKGTIAVIYLCCCRNTNRRSSSQTNNVVDTECGTSPTHIPYDPSGPGAPPSYEDLVKDGVLNHAYDQDTCGPREGASSGSELGAPPVVPACGLPAPPPYSAVVPQTSQDQPMAAAAAATVAPCDNDSQVPS